MPIAAIFRSIIAGITISAAAEAPGLLKAGSARIKLTPPAEMKASLGGYGERMSKPAEGVHDHIYAKTLVLSDGTKKFALVTLDILGLPPGVKPRILGRLMDAGWRNEAVLLLPSHSHTSIDMSAINPKNIVKVPQIGIYQPELLEFVVGAAADLILRAEKNLTPAIVGTGEKNLAKVSRNRRKGDSITDPQLVVTRVDRADGKPLAVLVNWAAHPTFMDASDMFFSGDWPGYLQRELEALIGGDVTAMYYNGAQADQSPTPTTKAAGSGYEQAERYGRAVAIHAWKVYRSIKPGANVAFAFNLEPIALPEPVAHPSFMETGGAEYGLSDTLMETIFKVMTPRQTHSTALRLGDLLIAGVPGEPIAQLGLQIKAELRKAGVKYPVIGGLADEWVSYILSPEEYGQGGYESSVSFYGPNLGPTIVEGVLKAARPIAATNVPQTQPQS